MREVQGVLMEYPKTRQLLRGGDENGRAKAHSVLHQHTALGNSYQKK